MPRQATGLPSGRPKVKNLWKDSFSKDWERKAQTSYEKISQRGLVLK
jgi:hypothetical protein